MNSRHYRIAAAAERPCVSQAAAAALQRARACVQSKCVRVRAWCSKVCRNVSNKGVIRLRAVTVFSTLQLSSRATQSELRSAF